MTTGQARRTTAWWTMALIVTGAVAVCLRTAPKGQQADQVPTNVVIGATDGLFPNLSGNISRPLRYRPDGTDFVIENGAEFFNRPLYGGNTAFRVDAGDRPEFTLYLPGRGGNLRFGLSAREGLKWLHQAARIVTRYRPGAMLYEIEDPWLGRGGVIRLTVLARHDAEGVIVQAQASNVPPGIDLLIAYGGVNGQRGQRDGDIGTEKVPIGEYFQLRPEFCADNVIAIGDGRFTLRSKVATLAGVVPPGTTLAIADAAHWGSVGALFASADTSRAQDGATDAASPRAPVVVGRVALGSDAPLYVEIHRTDAPASSAATATSSSAADTTYDRLAGLFADVDRHFRDLRTQVVADTPDPYINLAVAALCVAADAVWDEPSATVQHGAVAWRTRLLGWRGPYAMDALGWHDRARRHLTYWAGRQNTTPIPDTLPPPEAATNLARSETALHSNGDMSNSHYDMNLVYIDALFRHLEWSGDLDFARASWPVIERHLAWERRLFRRTFGPERLPLYEAYAAIWASDDLEYHGGGVAHASAYNFFHNLMAARLATRLGKDASRYEFEAKSIAKAMRQYLWLPGQGTFAEFKDGLGLQLVHPSSGVWTFYHTMDSGLPTPAEAWRMAHDVDLRIPHLPVSGPGVPTDDTYHVVSTTNWMPYTWSINNVVMGEVVHTALGYWQAGRADEAFRLTKSALLAAMYMGICPGNVGSMSYLDVYRRESQRDFADPAGVLSRAIVEGLFGIRPDGLGGTLVLRPGFPASWDHASLRHPDVSFSFRRTGATDVYEVSQRFGRLHSVTFDVPATRSRVVSVEVDGRAATWQILDDGVTPTRVRVRCAPSPNHVVRIAWDGEPASVRRAGSDLVASGAPAGAGRVAPAAAATESRAGVSGGHEPVALGSFFNDLVTEIFRPGKYVSPRSSHVSLAIPSQGIGGWAGSVNATAEIDDGGLRAASAAGGGRITLPSGVPFVTPGPGATPNIVFVSQWNNYPREVSVPVSGRARRIWLLMAGSTNWMQSRLDNGEVIARYQDGTTARLALHNPTTWWPIDQDYFVDDYAFALAGPLPVRVDLKTGRVRVLDASAFKGQGRTVPGGAATVLDLRLNPAKPLASLTVRALANDVVIGLMAATLER
jgi:hypothetical protein